jgi:hypothetical protein
MADRFLIGPMNSTQQSDLKPWALMDQSFPQLTNMYYFRGRITKRFGSEFMVPSDGVTPGFEQLVSRLAIEVGTVAGDGTAGGTVPGSTIAGTTNIGQLFAVGPYQVSAGPPAIYAYNLYTVYQANGAMNPSNPATSGTYNTTNAVVGAWTLVDLVGNAGMPVYWFPSLPVMGLPTYESGPINDLPTFAFDTRFAYQYTNAGWSRIGNSTTAPNPGIWTGADYQLFWCENYQGDDSSSTLLFVTNNNPPDLMQYWDGAAWNTFNPIYDAAGDTVTTCLMIIAFKNRLLLANTTEMIGGNPFNFPTRIRWSSYGSAIGTYSWYSTYGAANYSGAGVDDNTQTQQAIVGSEFIKDRLIFSYTKSTYEFAYTGNQEFPFIWNLLNTELGAESTFSSVPFDKFIITVGNVGVHQCNGSNVDRIDELIPDEVFQISNENNGVQRVYGIRDYYSEMAYWTYPNENQNASDQVYPNRVFVYNYRSGAWSFNTDTITCFGYYDQVSDQTWQTTLYTWQELDEAWDAGTQQGEFRQVIAGNQEGYVFIINRDLDRNAGALQITNIATAGFLTTLTIYNNNLSAFENLENSAEYILIENVIDNGVGGTLTELNGAIFPITATTLNTVTIDTTHVAALAGTYGGGGTAARVSNINILTKEFNPYRKDGKNVYINKVEFLVDRTIVNPDTALGGAVTVDALSSSSDISTIGTANAGVLFGENPGVLETTPYDQLYYPKEQNQQQLWHNLVFQVDGNGIQFRFYMSPEQMINPDTSLQDFTLNAIVLYAKPISRLQ